MNGASDIPNGILKAKWAIRVLDAVNSFGSSIRETYQYPETKTLVAICTTYLHQNALQHWQ